MNLRRVYKGNTFVVGNLNDYINVINKTNINGRSELKVSDLQDLEKDYNNLTLSYNVETAKDKEALKSIRVNNSLYLNIFLI